MSTDVMRVSSELLFLGGYTIFVGVEFLRPASLRLLSILSRSLSLRRRSSSASLERKISLVSFKLFSNILQRSSRRVLSAWARARSCLETSSSRRMDSGDNEDNELDGDWQAASNRSLNEDCRDIGRG